MAMMPKPARNGLVQKGVRKVVSTIKTRVARGNAAANARRTKLQEQNDATIQTNMQRNIAPELGSKAPMLKRAGVAKSPLPSIKPLSSSPLPRVKRKR